jgi:hypothetical protein
MIVIRPIHAAVRASVVGASGCQEQSAQSTSPAKAAHIRGLAATATCHQVADSQTPVMRRRTARATSTLSIN